MLRVFRIEQRQALTDHLGRELRHADDSVQIVRVRVFLMMHAGLVVHRERSTDGRPRRISVQVNIALPKGGQ